jgi:hypothetical protein
LNCVFVRVVEEQGHDNKGGGLHDDPCDTSWNLWTPTMTIGISITSIGNLRGSIREEEEEGDRTRLQLRN